MRKKKNEMTRWFFAHNKAFSYSWSGLAKFGHIPTSAYTVPFWFSKKCFWPEARQGWKRGLKETDGVKVISAGGIYSLNFGGKREACFQGLAIFQKGFPSCSLPPTFQYLLFELQISLESVAPSGSQLHPISYSHPWARMGHGRGPWERGKRPGERKGVLMGEEQSQIKCRPGSVLSI